MFDPCITHHFTLPPCHENCRPDYARQARREIFVPMADLQKIYADKAPAFVARPCPTPRGVFILATRPARIAICASARRSNCASDLALTPASHHWRDGGRLFAPHGTAPSQAHHRHRSQALQRRRGQGNNSPTAKMMLLSDAIEWKASTKRRFTGGRDCKFGGSSATLSQSQSRRGAQALLPTQ